MAYRWPKTASQRCSPGAYPRKSPLRRWRRFRALHTSPRSPRARIMPREWSDLFVLDGPPGTVDGEQPEGDTLTSTPSGAHPKGHTLEGAGKQAGRQSEEAKQRRRGMFRRLRENLSKTRQALGSEIQATLFAQLDEPTWE